MPISEEQRARIANVGKGANINQPPPKQETKVTKTPLQITYPNLTDDKMSELFGDNEDVAKDFKYLMNGMDKWNRDAIVNKGVYGQSKVYFTEAKKAAIKVADYYTANSDKLYTQKDVDKYNNEYSLLVQDYANKHTLANISLSTVIDDKKKAQFLKGGVAAKGMTDFGEEREGSKLVFDYDTRKIITKTQLEEKSETVFRNDKFYTDLKTKKEDPWYVKMFQAMPGYLPKTEDLDDMGVEQSIDKTAGYKAFYKGTQNRPKEVDNRLDYFIKNWTQQSVFLMNESQISKFPNKSEHKLSINKTRGYVNDILMAASKSNNEEIKTFATKMNQGLLKLKGDWAGTQKFIRENGKDINSIVNHKEFSYYAKERLYNKYKEDFKNTRYIHDPEHKQSTEHKAALIDKYSSQLDLGLTTLKGQRADYKLAKEEAIGKLNTNNSSEELFKKTMFNKMGDPLSYGGWIKQFPIDGRSSDLYTQGVKKFYTSIEQLKATGEYNALFARKAALNRLSETEKKEVSNYGTIYNQNTRHDKWKGPSNFDLEGSYNNYKETYKKQFNDIEFKQSFDRGSMENGMGANGMYELEQREINFKIGTSKKAVNASELITKITKSLEGGESDIVVLNQRWGHLDSKRDFDGVSDKEHLTTINNFFKDKDKSNFNLSYINKYKDPGNVVYVFKNLTTKKEISIAMPKSTAKNEFREAFAMAEYDDSDDFHFNLKGTKNLMNYLGNSTIIKSAEIFQDSGEKMIKVEANSWDPETKSFTLEEFQESLGPSGSLSIDDATNASLIWLKEYEKQMSQYKK